MQMRWCSFVFVGVKYLCQVCNICRVVAAVVWSCGASSRLWLAVYSIARLSLRTQRIVEVVSGSSSTFEMSTECGKLYRIGGPWWEDG